MVECQAFCIFTKMCRLCRRRFSVSCTICLPDRTILLLADSSSSKSSSVSNIQFEPSSFHYTYSRGKHIFISRSFVISRPQCLRRTKRIKLVPIVTKKVMSQPNASKTQTVRSTRTRKTAIKTMATKMAIMGTGNVTSAVAKTIGRRIVQRKRRVLAVMSWLLPGKFLRLNSRPCGASGATQFPIPPRPVIIPVRKSRSWLCQRARPTTAKDADTKAM